MSDSLFDRREFLAVAATVGAAAALPRLGLGAGGGGGGAAAAPSRLKVESFDYEGVMLRPSRWQRQYQSCRDFYLSISNDDILCGYRRAAGAAAPGRPLGGWCAANSSTIFGQWLSGMARMYKATGDKAMRDKAVFLMTEWAKSIKPTGDPGMRHYPFEKLVCGLVDMKLYGGVDEAAVILEKVCDYARANFNHDNVAAGDRRGGYAGSPGEWYTMGENLFRAYQVTGNEKFRTFAEMWLYPAYWNKFADTWDAKGANGVHAYSHVNTWSSCAMAYAVTGDEKYLRILRNAYDFLQNVQCFATGGFGPTEFIATSDGGIGRSLDTRTDSFETGCGSWAAFKMSRYLIEFTGEARYGDWAERILYNGIGAALPVAEGGKNFYYSDYKMSGAFKVYNWEMWTCCSGTYIQAVADYHNIIYYKDATSLYVNLFVPSEVTWRRSAGVVKVIQETTYPESETTTLTLETAANVTFPLKFRVPGWSKDVSVKVNGAAANVKCEPGTWATVEREWKSGDKVEIHIPLALRMVAVDKQHPDRVAFVRGPVVLVLEASRHDPLFRLPATDEELNKWVTPYTGGGGAGDHGVQAAGGIAGAFSMRTPEGPMRSVLRPFYTIEENFPYNMYFDRKSLPYAYW